MSHQDIIPTRGPEARSEEKEHPDEPMVGRWYWVKEEGDDEAWLGCVVEIGSNYIKIDGPFYAAVRIHFDNFWKVCKHEPDAESIIQGEVERGRSKVASLMAQVYEVTARLGVGVNPALTSGESDTQALAVSMGDVPADKYKQDLVRAERQELPTLFNDIERANKDMATWMSASLIPLRAKAQALRPLIGAIQARVHNVELYAGLVEQVTTIRDGEPAEMTTPIHLMQRRHYMDEECLAQYRTGGMEFKDVSAFDEWLAQPENRARILPFPRCIVAFQVRRASKPFRGGRTFSDFINFLTSTEENKSTFLYIRNGEQLHRLSTSYDFGHNLFPDMGQTDMTGMLYAKAGEHGVSEVITENQYLGLVEEDEAKERERARKYAEADEEDKWQWEAWRRQHRYSEGYTPFNKENVYYDEIAKYLADQVAKHNRLTLVLQGLLDRSMILHPHPPWALWTQAGFKTGLVLVYDSSRALHSGEKPDFEAYCARLNSAIRAGSVTIGQEDLWELAEGRKFRDRNPRIGFNGLSGGYSDEEPRHRPYGNPGPGFLAQVAKCSSRTGRCTFEWERRRVKREWRDQSDFIPVSFTVEMARLFNVSAYKPGDFHMFFDDPRTREEYLEWAPLLLSAEEYHAGRMKVGSSRHQFDLFGKVSFGWRDESSEVAGPDEPEEEVEDGSRD